MPDINYVTNLIFELLHELETYEDEQLEESTKEKIRLIKYKLVNIWELLKK